MILVVDIGNTNIVLGVYEKESLITNWRMGTNSYKTTDQMGMFLKSLFHHSGLEAEKLEHVIISSVVPNIMFCITQSFRDYFGIDPMVVGVGMKTGIRLNMADPKQLGADRIVNMVAAREIYGGPAVVIDYGTATTYDVVDKEGKFITGFIAPGIQICADALYQRAAQLPKVEIKRLDSLIVRNTVGSLQAGIVMGKVGETIYIIKKLKEELKEPNLKVVATGGLAKIIDEDGTVFDYLDPFLTLKGLRILYEKNKKGK